MLFAKSTNAAMSSLLNHISREYVDYEKKLIHRFDNDDRFAAVFNDMQSLVVRDNSPVVFRLMQSGSFDVMMEVLRDVVTLDGLVEMFTACSDLVQVQLKSMGSTRIEIDNKLPRRISLCEHRVRVFDSSNAYYSAANGGYSNQNYACYASFMERVSRNVIRGCTLRSYCSAGTITDGQLVYASVLLCKLIRMNNPAAVVDEEKIQDVLYVPLLDMALLAFDFSRARCIVLYIDNLYARMMIPYPPIIYPASYDRVLFTQFTTLPGVTIDDVINVRMEMAAEDVHTTRDMHKLSRFMDDFINQDDDYD